MNSRPSAWSTPETLVAASAFHGVHGLAIDAKGRLLAGDVSGNTIWEVDRRTGRAQVFIASPNGQADDIAVGPKGELAWSGFLEGVLRIRDSETAPIRVLARNLPGINSLAFDQRNGKFYASQVFLGDALWEMDPAGSAAPRLIAKGMGGLNGFEVGPDGLIYGPLWFKGQVVRINPADGAITVLASGFKTPAAVNLDGKGNLWTVDTKTGEVIRVALATGAKTVMAQLPTALDNLAIAPEGTVYVSNMADNAVYEIDPLTGKTRQLLSGKIAQAAAVKLADGKLLLPNLFSFRSVDPSSGEVADIKRMQSTDLEYPTGIGVGKRLVALSSWFSGSVQLLDRATMQTVDMVHGLRAPYDAIPMDDGSLLIAELGTGTLLRASGEHYKDRKPIAQNLPGPTQMVLSPDAMSVMMTEAAGNLVRIDLATGARTVIVDKLALPKGLARTPWGSYIVAEGMARRLVEVDPSNGTSRVVAENLPIGLEAAPGLPPPYMVTGVEVDADGVIYVSCDRNNSVLKIKPVR